MAEWFRESTKDFFRELWPLRNTIKGEQERKLIRSLLRAQIHYFKATR